MRDPTAVTDGLPIDAVLPLDHVTLELAQEIDRLAPFGEGNPAVTFAARDVTVEHDRTFGRKGEHREVTIADREGHTQKLIWWRGAEIDLPDAQLDVAFQIKTSTFRGETALSIEWVDFRETEVPIAACESRAPPLQIRSDRLAHEEPGEGHAGGISDRATTRARSGDLGRWRSQRAVRADAALRSAAGRYAGDLVGAVRLARTDVMRSSA